MQVTQGTRNTSLTWSRAGALAIVLMLGATGNTAVAQEVEFSYNGDNGPAHWSQLNSDWETCGGASKSPAQSPINLRNAKVDDSLTRLELTTYPTGINIFNNGHTIEQSYDGTGSQIIFGGVNYDLKQFHFHTLSEHTIRGRHTPLEMHAVFSEPGGAIVVVSQLFRLTPRSNAFIQTLIDAGLPVKDGDSSSTGTQINLSDGLRNLGAYFTYQGSLTTPPCSEVVSWVVLRKRANLSRDQYQAFRQILGNNFRPIQATNGRVVRMTKRRGKNYDKVSGPVSTPARATPTKSSTEK